MLLYDDHRQIPAKIPIVLVDFQALQLGNSLNGQTVEGHASDKECCFLFGKLCPVFNPLNHSSVLGTDGLASHATNQAMVPGWIDPSRKISR